MTRSQGKEGQTNHRRDYELFAVTLNDDLQCLSGRNRLRLPVPELVRALQRGQVVATPLAEPVVARHGLRDLPLEVGQQRLDASLRRNDHASAGSIRIRMGTGGRRGVRGQPGAQEPHRLGHVGTRRVNLTRPLALRASGRMQNSRTHAAHFDIWVQRKKNLIWVQ